ncbi:hypothetical protein D9615_009424 [Tricholomella constricta]|uniref:Uncharacterized protein n=1 Tax=Tricholomella constricta TaxID=117010 RepID=A0A8H5GYG3_9AGAR|nr:hypothetical protein D9615_009424 [Tricholomella constricta]
MNLSELLNPASEDSLYDSGTEQDIYEAVMDRRRAEDNREMNGGDVFDGDVDDLISETRPTRQEALTAASVLLSFVADVPDDYARKIEAVVAGFGRQTRLDIIRSAQPTNITHFFPSRDP